MAWARACMCCECVSARGVWVGVDVCMGGCGCTSQARLRHYLRVAFSNQVP